MEVFLIIVLFVSTALSLNFIVNEKPKLSGTFNVINLCIIVALAYQLKLVDTIILLLVGLGIIVAVTMILLHKRKKTKNQEVFNAKIIENKER